MIINNQLIITTLITLSILLIILRLFLKRQIPTSKLKRWWKLISDKFHDHQILKVPEFNDNSLENQLFRHVSIYLNSLENSDFTNLFSGQNAADIRLSLNPNQTFSDEFLDAPLIWKYDVVSPPKKSFLLKIRKRDKRRVLKPYLQYIHSIALDMETTRSHRVRDIRLFINNSSLEWKMVPFTHTASFETVTMDSEIKSKIKCDLETFLKSKNYCHKLGLVWRRSFLLYGPSGTGKSSFVAAMAKLLAYDVYDLDISKADGGFELKDLLLKTSPKSLVVIEDFDKYLNSRTAVWVSSVLNFMDGIVNSCCEERVMVFTMTCKDDIDPAILRSGRVDVHIYFPLCDFNNFKSLASSYLGVKEHKLFPIVEEMFNSGATLSPAEICELMIANRYSSSRAIRSVINALQMMLGGCEWSESCNGTPKSGLRSRSSQELVDESGDEVGVIGCTNKVKEFGKFYGFLRRKN